MFIKFLISLLYRNYLDRACGARDPVVSDKRDILVVVMTLNVSVARICSRQFYFLLTLRLPSQFHTEDPKNPFYV